MQAALRFRIPRGLPLAAALSCAALSASPIRAERPRIPDRSAAREAFDAGLRSFELAVRLAAERAPEDEVPRLYREAAANFVRAWEAGAESTEVATNAANCYALGGDIGRAVLFYRRALALSPSNQAAQSGLEHLRAELPIRRSVRGGAEILRALFFWYEGLSYTQRRRAFLVLYVAAFVCLAISRKRRAVFLPFGTFLLATSLVLLGSLFIDALASSVRRDGVIVAEVQGRLGDDHVAYSPSHSKPFPPGTEVTVLEMRTPKGFTAAGKETWLHVRLLDGSLSWVPAGAVEMVLGGDIGD